MKVLLDAGHGGVIDGIYVTAGKRSPLWKDGTQLFEGVFNRRVVEKIKYHLNLLGIEYLDVVNTNYDTSLVKRVAKANEEAKKVKNCIYVSIHANAGPETAAGYEIFTSKGKTNSDTLASKIVTEFSKLSPDTKLRIDNSDGDVDKEEDFYVLKNTSMPSVLVECGFMTNFEECKKLMSDEYQEILAKSTALGIFEYYKSLKLIK